MTASATLNATNRATPWWTKDAALQLRNPVMAGLVPAICAALPAVQMPGTGPAMTGVGLDDRHAGPRQRVITSSNLAPVRQ